MRAPATRNIWSTLNQGLISNDGSKYVVAGPSYRLLSMTGPLNATDEQLHTQAHNPTRPEVRCSSKVQLQLQNWKATLSHQL
jgi:hypothetical protein